MGEFDGSEICKQLKSLPAYNALPIVLYPAMVETSAAIETCNADLILQKLLTAEALAGHLVKLNRACQTDLTIDPIRF